MLSESEKPIDETQKELNEVIINSYYGDFEEKGDGLYKKHTEFQQQQEKRRKKKWEKLRNINCKHNLEIAAPVTSKRYVTRMNNAFEDDNKSSGIDLSKIGT